MVITKKPEWIRVKGVDERVLNEMKALLPSILAPLILANDFGDSV